MPETATPTKKKAVGIAPFVVEADHPRNCDLIVQCLTGVCDRRLRSKIKTTTTTIQGTVRSPSSGGHQLPEIPGQLLRVDPANCEVEIFDPLHNNEEKRDAIGRFFRNTGGVRADTQPNGVPLRKGKLDRHQMKTLCRELLGMVKAGEMKHAKGPRYDLSDCDEMPGDYLNNPGATIPTGQPKFEKDMDEFREKANRMGSIS